MVAQKGFVQAAAFVAADDVYGLAVARDFAQRVSVGVVHRRGGDHGRWVEGFMPIRLTPKALHVVVTALPVQTSPPQRRTHRRSAL